MCRCDMCQRQGGAEHGVCGGEWAVRMGMLARAVGVLWGNGGSIRVLKLWIWRRGCFVEVDGDGEAFPEEGVLYDYHCELSVKGAWWVWERSSGWWRIVAFAGGRGED